MIRVNIWLPSDTNVGHAAAQVGCAAEPYATYISWWPDPNGNWLKPEPGARNTEQGDIDSEQSLPHEVREIDGLRDEDAATWWEDFLNDRRPVYKLGTKNCSWAVVMALKAAGADRHFPWYRVDKKYNVDTNLLNVEEELFRYIRGVGAAMLKGHPWAHAVVRPLIDMGDRLLPTWSPRDALIYVNSLIDGLNGASPDSDADVV